MFYLLDDWPAVAERLRKAGSAALFLDFDGTLAPLVSNPGQAEIHSGARVALVRLAANPRIRTWVISGRRWADVRARVAVPGVRYLGVHGGEADGAAVPAGALRAVTEAYGEFASRLNGALGVLIENKGVAFAVHHRSAPYAEVSRARHLLEGILARFRGALRMVPGDRVWEVLPREIRGKGDAVRKEWRSHFPQGLPIYIGNDRTDEGAFAALKEGVTARVGPVRSTRAQYAVRSCAEVAQFLERLEQEMRAPLSRELAERAGPRTNAIWADF